METIDITPRWVDVLPIFIAVLENPHRSKEGFKTTIESLQQMAQVADMYVELSKKGLPSAIQVKYTDLYQYGDIHEVIIHVNNTTKKLTIPEHEIESYIGLFSSPAIVTGNHNQDKLYTK